MNFVFSELGTTGSESEGRIVIKGAYQAKNIESLLRKYISEYVKGVNPVLLP